MPQSLAHVVLHVAFSTKNRAPFLKDADLRKRLHAYMAGVLQTMECADLSALSIRAERGPDGSPSIEKRRPVAALHIPRSSQIGCEPILIGGVEDHVHLLCNLSRTVTIAELVEDAKKAPSKWMKEQGLQYRDFFWQSGYGAFSVSQSNVEQVRAYIASQEEHHRKVSFQDEFRALCRKHGVQIDERYVWD